MMEFNQQQLRSLEAHLEQHDPKTRFEAFDYANLRRIQSLTFSGRTLTAKIKGSTPEPYTVHLFYDADTNSWDSDSSCSLGYLSKYTAALTSFIIKTGKQHIQFTETVTDTTSPSESREFELVRELEAACQKRSKPGTRLRENSKTALTRIAQLYQDWTDGSSTFDAIDLKTLFKSAGDATTPLRIPENTFESTDPLSFWHLLIHCAKQNEKKLRVPAQLVPLCDTAESEVLIHTAMEELSRQNWNQWMAQFSDTETAQPLPASVRLVIDQDKFSVHGDETGLGNFKRMTLRQMTEWMHGDRPIRGSQRLLLSELDPYGSDQTKFSLTAQDGRRILRRILTQPELRPLIYLKNQSHPLTFLEDPVEWHLDATGTKDRFTLHAGGRELEGLKLTVLEGQPGIVLIEDAAYSVDFIPSGWGLELEESGAVEIPRGSLLSSGGVKLARKLNVNLQQEYETSIFRRTWQVSIFAEVSHTRGEDLINFKLQSESEDKKGTVLHYSKDGWQQPPAPKAEASVIEEIWLGADDTRLLMESLEPYWNPKTETFQIDCTQKNITTLAEWSALRQEAQFHARGELTAIMRPRSRSQAQLSISVEPSGQDWFDVVAKIDTGEENFSAEEMALLMKSSGQWIKLPKKGWHRIDMPDEADVLTHLSDLGMSPGKTGTAKTKLHALQLARAESTGVLDIESSRQIRSRLTELETGLEVDQPKTIQAELRPYQREGVNFLAYLSHNRFGGILADDMGLGKTLQTLTWLAWLHQRVGAEAQPSLVICPKSVVSNWAAEAQRFYPTLPVHIIEPGTASKVIEKASDACLVVMNYAQMRLRREELAGKTWLAAVLDEGQFIKNPGSQTAKAAFALNAKHRIVLTGTPIENRLSDLWSLMRFAMPAALGTEAAFKQLSSDRGDGLASKRVGVRLKPFFLRRTKKAVAPELPERIEEDVTCALEGKQQTLYEAELKKARQLLKGAKNPGDFNEARFNILASLMKLRQICCHPALLQNEAASQAPSAKLEALDELLDPLRRENEKVLVFSQFTSFLDLIEDHLTQEDTPVFKLTGKTNKREQLIHRFRQTEGHAVFLISLKAGGSGLNLTEASYVVMMDPWWNPAVENQAIDRAHRIGQKKTVIAYRMLAQNSLEEKIRSLQKDKKDLADSVLGETSQENVPLTMEDFQFLLER
ncbi:MAG: DEAD/DEAH box helicase [Verrucomicrobiota bacterium]